MQPISLQHGGPQVEASFVTHYEGQALNTENSPDTCWPADRFQDGETTAPGNSGTMDKRHHLTSYAPIITIHGALGEPMCQVKEGYKMSEIVWRFEN